MLWIFLSVCCTVIVSVMLKLAKRYHIDVYQAVTWNYSMAILLAWIFLKPHLNTVNREPLSWYLLLGLLLPILFIVLARSVRLSGIVRTDIAQRLSLFIPLIASFLFFNEQPNTLKITGLIVGLIAIICTIPLQQRQSRKATANAWIYLFIVFIGLGIIDVLLKQVALLPLVPFTTSFFVIFTVAFAFSLAGLLYQVLNKTMRFSWPHILIGWVLGIVNFGNILFYLKAHQALARHPSVVFSGVNIGVIILGTLTGVLIFKEKLSLLNKVGIALALIAIVLISRS